MQVMVHRRERIVITAIDVINELGVQALSTKRIAQMEGVSESTVFKHFASKNAILHAVLDTYGQFDSDIIESIQLKELACIDSLFYYTEAYTQYYENYPAITAITQGMDEMRYIDGLAPVVDAIKSKRRCFLMALIERGQKEGVIKPEVLPEVVADIIVGMVLASVGRWRSESFGFGLNRFCKVALQVIVDGIVINPLQQDVCAAVTKNER